MIRFLLSIILACGFMASGQAMAAPSNDSAKLLAEIPPDNIVTAENGSSVYCRDTTIISIIKKAAIKTTLLKISNVGMGDSMTGVFFKSGSFGIQSGAGCLLIQPLSQNP